jgi:hypothetical protein
MVLGSRFVPVALAASLVAGLTGALIGRSVGEPGALEPPPVSVASSVVAEPLANEAPVAPDAGDGAEAAAEGLEAGGEPLEGGDLVGTWGGDGEVVAAAAPARLTKAKGAAPAGSNRQGERAVARSAPATTAAAVEATDPVPQRRRVTSDAPRAEGRVGEPVGEPVGEAPPLPRREQPAPSERARLARRGDRAPSYPGPGPSPAPYVYKKPSFWERHRDPLTTAAAAGGGAILGAIIGGKKGAWIGAAAGAGGGALYTYRMRKRTPRRYGQSPPPGAHSPFVD